MCFQSGGGSRDTERTYHAALAAPSFWVAVVLLVLNDHLLKSAGVCPSWLTGKLSDFAGLIVGPAVAAALCPGRWQRLQLMASGSVVLVFVATELSASCALALEQAYAWFGFHARLWPDLTDLTALAVLPWTWRLLRTPRRKLQSPILQRLGLGVASLACVATVPEPVIHHGPFLVNHTGERIRVEIEWFEGPDVCTTSLSALVNQPGSLTTLAQHTFELPPNWTMRLDRPTESEGDVVGVCPDQHEDDRGARGSNLDAGSPAACVVLQISGAELPPHLVRADADWTTSDWSRCEKRIPVYEDPEDGALAPNG